MLLDFLTLFFIVAGCWLLWLNLRPRRSNVILTNSEDYHPPSRSRDTKDDISKVDALEQHLTDAGAKPEAASSTLHLSSSDAQS
jgi:hypothetical protein